MRVLPSRLLSLLLALFAVTGFALLGVGVSALPAGAVSVADDPEPIKPAPTPPMPAPQAPDAGKPSAPQSSGNPVPASPPGTDPCGAINGIPASPACGGVGKNQAANDKCQSESFHDCNKPMTGAAQETWQKDQDSYAKTQSDFHAVQREQSGVSGAAELCHSSSGMRDRLDDTDVIVPPSFWWSC